MCSLFGSNRAIFVHCFLVAAAILLLGTFVFLKLKRHNPQVQQRRVKKKSNLYYEFRVATTVLRARINVFPKAGKRQQSAGAANKTRGKDHLNIDREALLLFLGRCIDRLMTLFTSVIIPFPFVGRSDVEKAQCRRGERFQWTFGLLLV